MSDGRICQNTVYGQHITVRCKGCGSLHSTKNIGGIDSEGNVHTARTLFDRSGGCKCIDPREFPLVHDCSIDDKK